MREDHNSHEIEQKVYSAFSTIQPDANFTARLRAEIDRRTAVPEGRWHWPRVSFRLAMFIGIPLVVILTIFLIGPQDILARARSLFSFIPGIGFVEEPNAYHLCQPAETSQDGITFKIERGGGSNQNLHLAGTITGLEGTPSDFHLENQDGKPVQIIGGGGGGGSQGVTNFDFDFLLPDQQMTWFFVMRPFPQNDLVLRLRFDLCPGTESLAETPSQELVQDNYQPSSTQAQSKGLTLEVVQVAQNQEATGVQLRIQADSSSPFTPMLREFYVDENGTVQPNYQLSDDLGNTYPIHSAHLIQDVADPSIHSVEFDALSPQARKAALDIQSATLLYDERLPFQFDPGETPTPGQTWDLTGKTGTTFTLNGFQIQLLKAQFLVESVQTGPEAFEEGKVIEFTTSISSPAKDLIPDCPIIEVGNTRFECRPADDGSGNWILRLVFFDPLPEETISGIIGPIAASQTGPWKLQWDLPVP